MAEDNGRENAEAQESRGTVLIALTANLLIAVMKAVAGILTGSAALLSEAGHSVADTVNEVLLLAALRRSERPADRRHPFGYGKERFFWSLIAAVSIFAGGAVFAFQEGIGALFEGSHDQPRIWVAYLVIGLSFLIEGVSWRRAVRQIRAEAAEHGLSIREHLRRTDDPTSKTVLLEDSAALIGLVLAAAGIGLHQLTGSSVWDAVAALLIGVLLSVVAYALGRTNRYLLIGRQADPRLVYAVRDRLAGEPEVETVVDLLTMVIGSDRVLLCARLDFVDSLSAGDLERACVRMTASLREEFAELDEIFLEPVPRTDPELRARVLARYGDALSG